MSVPEPEIAPLPEVVVGELVRGLLECCGGAAVLVLAPDPAPLVRALLAQGVEARGVADLADLAAHAPARSLLVVDVLERIALAELDGALRELRRVGARQLLATVLAAPGGAGAPEREAWERRFFAAGFRRHPLGMQLVPYAAREGEAGRLRLAFERVPDAAREEPARASPLDLLRASGRRADAAGAVYDLACRLVRPGDVVLDLCCAGGGGSRMLAVGSPAARVLGVDESEAAIEHARENYGGGSATTDFRRCEPGAIEFLPDASVDLIVCVELLDRLPEPQRCFDELARLLRPGGRLVLCARDAARSGAGESRGALGSGPSWMRLVELLGPRLRLERALVLSGGEEGEQPSRARELLEVALASAPARRAERWVLCAMRDPIGADARAYRETSFPDPGPGTPVHITSFGQGYDNPWLVKALVSIGMRTENAADRRAMALQVLERARPGSADEGAALCLLAYDRLAHPSAPGPSSRELLERIERYHAQADDRPHAFRWRLSNQYVRALLLRAEGRRGEALEAFLGCGRMDPLRFAPILATKCVDALFQAGLMSVADGDAQRASALWQESIQVARRALGADWRSFLGDLAHPIPFGLPEASQVLDLAGRSAYALDALAHWEERPGWSWSRAHTSLRQQIELQQRALHELDRQARATASRAQTLAWQLADAREELARIQSSRAWIWLQRCRRLRARLLGAGTSSKERGATLRALLPAPLRGAARRARSTWRGWSARGLQRIRLREATARLPSFERDGRRLVVLQLQSFDKGGLEEVVLTLARTLCKEPSLRVVVLVVGQELGHLGRLASEQGIPILTLGENPYLLREFLRRCAPALVNLHYSTFGVEEYRRAGVPMVYTVHNAYVWADAAFVAEREKAFAAIERFVAVSRAVADFFVHRFGIDPTRVRTIPNGLDLEHVAAAETVRRAELGLREEDFVFLNVASFNIHKFHVLMVAAMERVVRELPHARLLFVGNTHEQRCREHVEARIERLGLAAKVRILDFVQKPRLMGLMRTADCFLLPSLVEGWSIAAMEAMYSELPLLLSDVGSARDLIEEEDIGIVVPNPYDDIRTLSGEEIARRWADERDLSNLDALVEAMLRVARDREGWKRRGRLGREKLLARFTAAHMGLEYLRCFDELIDAARSARAQG